MKRDKIVIADMYRYKGKQSFFALHQIYSKIKSYRPDVDVEFHILWDNNIENAESDREYWEELIDTYGFNIVSYDKQFFSDYIVSAYDIDREEIDIRLKIFPPLYHILMGHYFRRVMLFDYYLIYDDDILINYDFKDVIDAILDKRPVLITEPYHHNCDKSMFQTLRSIFGVDFVNTYLQKNPNQYGFNAGFQGMDLRMYDEFISASGFVTLLNMFNYSPVFDENGNQLIHGYDRTIIETQQQSFFSLMNIAASKNELYILDPKTTYVAPNFGYCELHGEIRQDDGYNGWGVCLKSNISHFIGHAEGGMKPKEFLDRVEEYLKEKGTI